jgi:AraC-like DNA-binding protein
MLNEDLDASNASGRVGYESASQFSREYCRLFGARIGGRWPVWHRFSHKNRAQRFYSLATPRFSAAYQASQRYNPP